MDEQLGKADQFARYVSPLLSAPGPEAWKQLLGGDPLVLFLDELPEFKRSALEVMRQPLEERKVSISRARWAVEFPSSFMLIASMNPCPCGYYGDKSGRCQCRPEQIKRYQEKLSGPLLDRIDLHIIVPALPASDLQSAQRGESSAAVRERVIQAYQRQQARQGKASVTSGYLLLESACCIAKRGCEISRS